MRENNLLSPHRCRRRGGNPHDGEIITHAPNLMWGTDGVRVFTVDDGWGWIFTAVEHWNAECVGWHVCKRGTAAGAPPDAREQSALAPSLPPPQIIHGRIYRNIAELRDAVRDFVELYNAQWIVEKNGYLSPAQARQAWHAAISIRPAA